jgi:hypothetical protein
MRDSGFKRWVVLGVLVSASGWVAACGLLPQQPGNESYAPGFDRSPELSGYNGTIQDLPTSIDPRTPETSGTPGRSLAMDPGERALLESRGMGGSGSTPPAQGSEGGSQYEGQGAGGRNEGPAKQDGRSK